MAKKKTMKEQPTRRRSGRNCSDFLEVAEWRVLRRAIDQHDAFDARFGAGRKVGGFDVCIGCLRAMFDDTRSPQEFREIIATSDYVGLSNVETRAIKLMMRAIEWATNEVGDIGWKLARVLYPRTRQFGG